MTYLTRQEAADRLQIDPSRITRLFDSGVLKGYRVGEGKRCQLFIEESSVQQRLENPGRRGRPQK